jgi:type IV secretory pathway VirB4 component
MFNLDLSNIFRSSENILSSYVIGLINIAMSLMIDNKNSGYEFMLYVDETHTIRHIKGVLQRLNQFVRICRSHNGGECLIDQGLDVIRPDSTVGGLYNEIFEQTEYNIFLKSKAGDVQKLVTLLDKAGKPLSETEQNYILTAGDGAGLLMSGVNERMRIQIDATF